VGTDPPFRPARLDQPTFAAVDDAGNIVTSDVPGMVLAISDQYVVFAGYSVRRVTR
jgi:hypothetical protein